MAEKFDAAFSHYGLEAGGDLLVVGHAHRIGALSDAYNLLGDGDLVLLDHLVVLYYIDGGLGSHESDAV